MPQVYEELRAAFAAHRLSQEQQDRRCRPLPWCMRHTFASWEDTDGWAVEKAADHFFAAAAEANTPVSSSIKPDAKTDKRGGQGHREN